MDLNKQSKNNLTYHNKKQENLKGNEKRRSLDVRITCHIFKNYKPASIKNCEHAWSKWKNISARKQSLGKEINTRYHVETKGKFRTEKIPTKIKH